MVVSTPIREDDAEDKAEFNSALALLKRVNELEYEIESCLIHWDLKLAYCYLESYENELDFSFKKPERDEVIAQKTKIVKLFNENPQFGNVLRDARGREYTNGAKVMPIIRRELMVLDKILRKIKHTHGMGMSQRGDGGMF